MKVTPSLLGCLVCSTSFAWSDTIFLNFPNRDAFDAVSSTLARQAVDEVGVVYHPSGEMVLDGEGRPVAVMSPSEGYAVNVRLRDGFALPAEIEPYVIYPMHPKRDFF